MSFRAIFCRPAERDSRDEKSGLAVGRAAALLLSNGTGRCAGGYSDGLAEAEDNAGEMFGEAPACREVANLGRVSGDCAEPPLRSGHKVYLVLLRKNDHATQ